MGQSVLYGRRARSGFLEAVKYRIWAYPVTLGQNLWGLIRILYHFAKALWTGEVFPLRPQRRITDHGRVVGYLDGDWVVFAGRKMALPFIILFAGIRLWDLVGFIFVAVIVAQFLVWFGVIESPGKGFTAIFWVAIGCLGLATMIESFYVIHKRRTVGLKDILALLNLNRLEPKPDTTQRVYRDDDTLAVKVRRGTEEFAGKISKKKRTGQD